jgi:hypothetical protein
MAHLEPPLDSKIVRDAGDEPGVKVFAVLVIGEEGSVTITPVVVKSTARFDQLRELQAQVDQWARALKAFIVEHPERLGL